MYHIHLSAYGNTSELDPQKNEVANAVQMVASV